MTTNDQDFLYRSYVQYQPTMTRDEFSILRDNNKSRELHLSTCPGHDWVICKSWHCFHGNELNRPQPPPVLDWKQKLFSLFY
jgi:hypothetical protein